MNEPSKIVSATQVLGLYNQEKPDDTKERVVDSVKEWYIDAMHEHGWVKADFHGSQCVLVADIRLGDGEDDDD